MRYLRPRVTLPLLLLKPSPAPLLPLLPQQRRLAAVAAVRRVGLALVWVGCWGCRGAGGSIWQSWRPCLAFNRLRPTAGLCQTHCARQGRSSTYGGSGCQFLGCKGSLHWRPQHMTTLVSCLHLAFFDKFCSVQCRVWLTVKMVFAHACVHVVALAGTLSGCHLCC